MRTPCPTATTVIGYMSILDESPGNGYKLCKKKLHWYLLEAGGRGCRECRKEYARNKYHTDSSYRSKRIASALSYEKKNKKRCNEKKKQKYWSDSGFRAKTLERSSRNFRRKWNECPDWRREKLKKTSEWHQKNTHYELEKQKRRKAAKINAMAPWINRALVKEIYREAAHKTRETGIKHHVDHVYPLISPFLCGLHVETNLQILTEEENCSKGNRIWPGQLDCQKGQICDIFPKELIDLLHD